VNHSGGEIALAAARIRHRSMQWLQAARQRKVLVGSSKLLHTDVLVRDGLHLKDHRSFSPLAVAEDRQTET
jgi:hypothetical protein